MRSLIVVLVAGCAPAQSAPANPDFDGHIEALRGRLKGKGLDQMAIRIEAPFVVLGNDPADVLARKASTVRWAVDHFEREFFNHRPANILDVYLFNNASSYERGVRILTGESPTTPYGFYSSHHGGLFMNIATGGGTLVHEIVHPYVEADFPNAPPWLNEGLGSLFEQSDERDGKIVGLTNWRLAGLQKAIKRGAVPSFFELTHMDSETFYAEERGTNYSQSRYLMYYLQEKGLLHDFYRRFRAARATDPSGYQTLVAVLGERDMNAFKARWEKFVAALTFP